MDLPVMPPVAPMLQAGHPAADGPYSFEPKWDRFRTIIFRGGIRTWTELLLLSCYVHGTYVR